MKWLKANNHYNDNNNNNSTTTTHNNYLGGMTMKKKKDFLSIWSSFSIHFAVRMPKIFHNFPCVAPVYKLLKKRKLAQANPLRWHHFTSKIAGNCSRRAVTQRQTVSLLTRPFWLSYSSWRCCNSGKILNSVGTHRQWWTDIDLEGNQTTSGFGILGRTQSCAHKFRLRLLSNGQ